MNVDAKCCIQRPPDEKKTRSSEFPLSLLLFENLQIRAQRFLDGVLGDEVDKVLDVSVSVGRQPVDGGLPHHGLGDLPGVVCEGREPAVRLELCFGEPEGVFLRHVVLRRRSYG